MKPTQLKQPRSGVTTATTSATPITKIGATSTAATTSYTVTTIVDGTAWDLSALSAGQIALGIWAVTTEGYRGRVTAVNDSIDTVTIGGGWITPDGVQLDYNISDEKPTDATAVTFHRVCDCKQLTVTAYEGNSVVVYAGFNSSLPSDGSDGDEISATAAQPNSIRIYGNGIDYFDVTKLYVICASSTPKISWIAI